MEKLKIGISACLLGKPVRYDQENKLDPYLAETWGHYFEYVPVCPEVESGLPVPREPSRLEGSPERPRFIARHSRTDHTERLERWGGEKIRKLEPENLGGFIFKSRSPSCGIRELKVYRNDEIISRNGAGIWARMFMERFPLLPVEDETRLYSPEVRELFIERVFVFRRWRDMLRADPTPGGLAAFHTRHKLLLMAHSPESYRRLGKLVSQAGEAAPKGLFTEYAGTLAKALETKATVRKHANVLAHIPGYFKRDLSPGEKQELLDLIDRYRAGQLPLIVPVTLLNRYAAKYDQRYLKEQYYLNPDPIELALRY